MQQAEAWLEQKQVPPKAAYFAALAMEEIVTNCIRYGYDDHRDHLILITITVAVTTLAMQIVDDGHPFDPWKAPAPDLSLQIEDRAQGGLGIHLLRSLADQVAYERRDGANHITLVKNFDVAS